MNFRRLFLYFSLLVATPLFAGSKGKLKVVVIDPQGAAVLATLLVHPQELDPNGKPPTMNDVTAKTDRFGVFSCELLPGFYDIVIFAVGFTPSARSVRIRGDKTISQEIKLDLNQEWLAEHGDKFFDPSSEVPLEPSRRRQQ